MFPADYGEMAEERRLAYVALTRGRQRVSVTHCAFRRGFNKPSLFIEDLPADNVVHGWLHLQGSGKQQANTTLTQGPVNRRRADADDQQRPK